MIRSAQELKKYKNDQEIKNRLNNIKANRKININSFYVWILLLANLIYIILLTINFLIVAVGNTDPNDKTGNNNLNFHLMFYIMPALLNILFCILVYFARLKITIGNFFIIFWAAVWVLAIILPFIVNHSSLTVIAIIGIFPLAINVIILFLLFYKLSKHRELLRIKYYQKKLSSL